MVDPHLEDARERAAGELAEAVLPQVRRYLTRSTADLRDIEERLAHSDATLYDEDLLADVDASHEDGRAIGWCLGVLAAAAGTDLLLARRERDGLRPLVSFVLEALGGRELEPPLDELPLVSTEHGEGWELPFLVAWTVLRAGLSFRAKRPLLWGLLEHGSEQSFLVERGAEAERETLFALASLVPGGRAVEEDDCFCIVLPAGSLVPRPGPSPRPSPRSDAG